MIDVMSWPGYLLIVMSVIAVFRCLIAFGTGQSNQGMIIGVIAIVALTLGLVWVMVEHRRVRRIEDRWHDEHPDVRRQRPDC